MLRAISEIAVAIIVTSVSEKPSCRASSMPGLAGRDDVVGVVDRDHDSQSATVAPDRRFADPQLPVQQREALFEVQRGVHVVERQAQLDHGERHLGLQADDHGVRAAQPGHVRDRAQRPCSERIHHVDRGDVDDDARARGTG